MALFFGSRDLIFATNTRCEGPTCSIFYGIFSNASSPIGYGEIVQSHKGRLRKLWPNCSFSFLSPASFERTAWRFGTTWLRAHALSLRGRGDARLEIHVMYLLASVSLTLETWLWFLSFFLYYCTTSFTEVQQSTGISCKTPWVKDVIQVMATSNGDATYRRWK